MYFDLKIPLAFVNVKSFVDSYLYVYRDFQLKIPDNQLKKNQQIILTSVNTAFSHICYKIMKKLTSMFTTQPFFEFMCMDEMCNILIELCNIQPYSFAYRTEIIRKLQLIHPYWICRAALHPSHMSRANIANSLIGLNEMYNDEKTKGMFDLLSLLHILLKKRIIYYYYIFIRFCCWF